MNLNVSGLKVTTVSGVSVRAGLIEDVESCCRSEHQGGRGRRRRRLGDGPRLRGSCSPVSVLHSLSWLFHDFTVAFSFCGICFQNDVSEKEQRWGAKTVAGSGHQEHIESGPRSLLPHFLSLAASPNRLPPCAAASTG